MTIPRYDLDRVFTVFWDSLKFIGLGLLGSDLVIVIPFLVVEWYILLAGFSHLGGGGGGLLFI